MLYLSSCEKGPSFVLGLPHAMRYRVVRKALLSYRCYHMLCFIELREGLISFTGVATCYAYTGGGAMQAREAMAQYNAARREEIEQRRQQASAAFGEWMDRKAAEARLPFFVPGLPHGYYNLSR